MASKNKDAQIENAVPHPWRLGTNFLEQRANSGRGLLPASILACVNIPSNTPSGRACSRWETRLHDIGRHAHQEDNHIPAMGLTTIGWSQTVTVNNQDFLEHIVRLPISGQVGDFTLVLPR
jgi:hypothetical protein